MKIFLDTDVLIDLTDPHSESGQLIKNLIKSADFSFWVSAASISHIHDRLSDLQGPNKAKNCLNYIQENISIIPLRHSIFSQALEKNDTELEVQLQIASAEAFKMDYIVTHNVDRFKSTYIPAFIPALFIEKMKSGCFDTATRVPFLDLKAQHHQIYNEIDDRITDIITNTGFILGKHVDEFEKGFAELQGTKYCIGVSSGTDALHIALMALGIRPGDAVIVPVNTFIATAEAVSFTGAVPVFVDCDEYYNVDVKKIAATIQKAEGGGEKERSWEVEKGGRLGTGGAAAGIRAAALEGEGGKARRAEGQGKKTKIKAIIPVHLYGQPANMDAVMALAEEYGLAVIEDACQAHLAEWQGKKVGALGAFGVFSFYPGKNLGAYGEAGALITNDEELYNKAKMIRQHGEIERYHHKVVGHNYRMEAIQGAVLSTKAKYIEGWTRKRQENARLYDELLSEIEGVEIPQQLDGVSAVYHLYVIQVDDRDGVQEHLQKNGIGTGLHYPVPLHLQEAYKHLGYEEGDFPVAERAAKRILSLPMYPELTERQIRYVCEKIKEYKEDRS